jgi:cytochrome oxidase Cu insertion factor (SCO1/SenC/PrrC family)
MMSARAKLLCVVGIAVAPILASYVVYFTMRDSTPWATTNHGTLLDPARSIAELGWVDARDSSKASPLGDGHWWLIVATSASCDDACVDAVTQLRQLHVLLNRDQSRVRRALLFDADVAASTLDDFEARYPKLGLLIRQGEPVESGVYVVDPHGNVILSYPYRDAGKPVLEDLQKLLKASQIG